MEFNLGFKGLTYEDFGFVPKALLCWDNDVMCFCVVELLSASLVTRCAQCSGVRPRILQMKSILTICLWLFM